MQRMRLSFAGFHPSLMLCHHFTFVMLSLCYVLLVWPLDLLNSFVFISAVGSPLHSPNSFCMFSVVFVALCAFGLHAVCFIWQCFFCISWDIISLGSPVSFEFGNALFWFLRKCSKCRCFVLSK